MRKGENMKIEFEIKSIPICPYCLGQGKLKAMQSAVYINKSIRANDTYVKCKYCKGTGLNERDSK